MGQGEGFGDIVRDIEVQGRKDVENIERRHLSRGIYTFPRIPFPRHMPT